jgi:D-apionolactonase
MANVSRAIPPPATRGSRPFGGSLYLSFGVLYDRLVNQLSRYERWYGRDEPPTARRPVRAGALAAEVEGPELRYIRVGDVEVVRRLYAAVRDRNWGTVPPTLSNVELEDGGDSFRLRFDARHIDTALGVDFSWQGEIAGGVDGTLAVTLEGKAHAAFDYNRIGWCVLHPAECAGRPFRARTDEGRLTGTLPLQIGAQRMVDGLPAPLFPAFNELEIGLGDGSWARFELEGDTFEMEDQRNWTDASFKTYSTPLALGFPHHAPPGQRFRQVVRLTITNGVRTPVGAHARRDDDVVIDVGGRAGNLPPIGLGAASHGRPPSAGEADLLAALRPAHLRVDLDLAQPAWEETLHREAGTAGTIGAALELAVFVDRQAAELGSLAGALRQTGIRVARLLAFRHDERTSSAATVTLVRSELGDATGGAPVYGGTNVLFTELNRFRPELYAPDGIAWPLNATVHASDDTSVAETPAMHGETVHSARAFCGDLPLAVTPVTFNQRFNPVATGPEPEPEPGELPSQVDRRQPSLLGAGWTLASAKHLAEAGAASVTYFETTGWRGVVESSDGSPVPTPFRSLPGMAFPLYHVLADLCELRGGEIRAARSNAPLAVEALVIRAGDHLVLLVANLTPARQRCRIGALPAGSVAVRRLDEQTFGQAAAEPASFRAAMEPLDRPDGDVLTFDLDPFAYLRVDTSL